MNIFFTRRKFRTDKEEIDYIVDLIAEPFIKDLQYQTIEQVKTEPVIERKTISRNSIAEGKIPKRQTISSRKVVNEEGKQITSDCNKIKEEIEQVKLSNTKESSEMLGQNKNEKKNEFNNMENLNEILDTQECTSHIEKQNMNLLQNEQKIDEKKMIDLNFFTANLEETNSNINCLNAIKTSRESVKKEISNSRGDELLEDNSEENGIEKERTMKSNLIFDKVLNKNGGIVREHENENNLNIENNKKKILIKDESHLQFNKNEQNLSLKVTNETIKRNNKSALCKNQNLNDQFENWKTEESTSNYKFIENRQEDEKITEKKYYYILRKFFLVIFRPRIFLPLAFIVSALFLTKYLKFPLKIGRIKIN